VLSAKTGLPVPLSQSPPDFAAAIAQEPAHGVLLANDVAHCFAPASNRINGG
jgi:hypothetical protein